MKTIFLSCAVLAPALGAAGHVRSTLIVQQFLKPQDKRFASFVAALDILSNRSSPTIVETGTARGGWTNCEGDGGSSLIFSRWATRYGGQFFSVDIDPIAIKNAKLASAMGPSVHFICSDSVAFLTQFPSQIDLLYLDSFDFDLDNPNPSQEHHLREIQAALPKLSSSSLVLIDDCNLPYGGKGKLVIEFLQQHGWKVINSGYQVLLAPCLM